MNTIEIQNLKKYFGSTKAIDGISLSVEEGKIMGFLGPNGAGKTTAIRCMMDFLRPDEGSITILGKDARHQSAELKNDVGYLSSEVDLYEDWTGQDHIRFIKGIRRIKNNAQTLIDQLEFDPSKRVRTLSTGNKQKLGLILALMHQPKVLILDEPTTGLDPLLQQTIYEILEDASENGTTVFMSSHNLAEVERLSDQVTIIKRGKIVAIEKIADIRKKRLYTVHLHYERGIKEKDLKIKGVTLSRMLSKRADLSVKGDIRPVLKEISKLPIKDIEVHHANLEDVFLEYYKK